jgi:hypothetical protein
VRRCVTHVEAGRVEQDAILISRIRIRDPNYFFDAMPISLDSPMAPMAEMAP